jgi:magnesium transporter
MNASGDSERPSTAAGAPLEKTALIERLVGDFVRRDPARAAEAMARLDIGEMIDVLGAQAPAAAAAVVHRLDVRRAADLLDHAPEPLARGLLGALDPSRAARILGQYAGDRQGRWLTLVEPPRAREIERLLRYPPDTAGGLMDPRVSAFHEGTTIAEALPAIPNVRERRIADVMIVNEDGELLGSVPLQSLAGADPQTSLGSLMQHHPPTVHAMAPGDEVVALLEHERLATLPVVDLEGRLVGVLRHDALIHTAQEDAVSDLQAMVGSTKQERALWTPWQAVRTRLPWLHVNLLTAFLAAAVVGLFDDTIARFTALAVLLPIVAGQSGNTGSQALAVTTRGLALREVGVFHWWRIVRKELAVGLLAGAVIAVVTSAVVYSWSGQLGLALVIGLAMLVSMGLAAGAGALVPIVLTALGRDPATASSIILTTITDVVGFGTFLGLATVLSSLLD